MKQIAGYVADYFQQIHRGYLVVISILLGLLVWANYYYKLNDLILLHSFSGRLWRTYLLFLPAFAVPWMLAFTTDRRSLAASYIFWLLLIISPGIFALKVSLQITNGIDLNNNYSGVVLQWPMKALAVFIPTFVLWYAAGQAPPFAGLTTRGFKARPYVGLLALMLPLLIVAGFSQDFQQVYPKLQLINQPTGLLQKLIFELSYGLDFFTIELFFRGFLILIFIKYGGLKSILPMAVFYCTIHFGKPMFECISSYFGGLILGAVVYNTRSIWGGLIVHLGIAWMMEIIGAIHLYA